MHVRQYQTDFVAAGSGSVPLYPAGCRWLLVPHASQTGFLSGRSTLEHLLTMRLFLEHANSSLHVLLPDIAKAYDTCSGVLLSSIAL